MKIAIVYASTEGQTRKICQFVLKHLAEAGHAAALVQASDAEGIDLADFDGAILAASVHVGRYQRDLVDFAKSHAGALGGMRTLFLSVSLSAAGSDPDDWAELKAIAGRFFEETGWTPDRTEQVAGAFKFSDYDFFKYWAMRWIESKKDRKGTAGTDREYTDWDALAALLADWTASN